VASDIWLTVGEIFWGAGELFTRTWVEGFLGAISIIVENVGGIVQVWCAYPMQYYKYLHVMIAHKKQLFSEGELFTICYRPSVCPSSVTFMHPTWAIEIFVSTRFNTLAIC